MNQLQKLRSSLPLPQLVPTTALFRSPPSKVTPLGNGVKVASQVFDSETATVSVRVNTGSVNDTKSGTNAFLSRLSQKKIASQLSGVKLNTQACREHTVYSARVLKGDAASVLAVIADGVANPPLDAQTVEAERANLVNEAGAASKRYQERLYYHLYQTAFMDSGLGKLPEGTVDGLKSIGVSDLEAYKKSFITGKNVVVIGAGSLDHDPLIDTATKLLGNISASATAATTPAVFVGSDIEYRFDSMREAHIALAFQSAPANSEDALTFQVMQSILGSWNAAGVEGNNAASRLAQELEETHSVSSFEAFNFAHKDTGLFGVKIAASPRGVEEAMYRLTYNCVRLTHEVCAEEVERAKNQLKTKLFVNSCDTDVVADSIGWQLLSYGRRVPTAELAARIDAISLDDVRQTADKYLNDEDHALAAVGPLHELPDYNWIRRRSYWHRF